MNEKEKEIQRIALSVNPSYVSRIQKISTYSAILIVIFSLLLSIGLIAVFSTSFKIGERLFDDPYFFIKRQVIWTFLSIIAFILFTRLPLIYVEKGVKWVVLLSILLSVIIFIPGLGKERGGVTRWIKIGNILFTPSELLKLANILYISYYYSRVKNPQDIRKLIIPFSIVLLSFGLVVYQQDVSNAILLLLVDVMLMFVANVPLWNILLVTGFSGLIFILFFHRVSYVAVRIFGFLYPKESAGAVMYQSLQALEAIRRGGWFGVGLGNGVQKLFSLPEAHTDYVFSALVEEIGIVGGIAIILIYILLLYIGVKIALKAKDIFKKILAIGVVLNISFCAFVNIFVNLGIIPPTGTTLPFISYGGSSLLISSISMGILIRCNMEDLI